MLTWVVVQNVMAGHGLAHAGLGAGEHILQERLTRDMSDLQLIARKEMGILTL